MTADLIARLEAATSGNFELEHQIAEAAYPHLAGFRQPDGDGWVGPGWTTRRPPPYTVSLDAVVALIGEVLPDHDWSIGNLPTSDDADHEEHHEFGCLLYDAPRSSPGEALGHGATAPLAACVALLRALSKEGNKP